MRGGALKPLRYVLGIDPGYEQSAVVAACDGMLIDHRILPNDAMLDYLRASSADAYACEMIASYGMPVGKEVFETCVWIGRFRQVCELRRFELVYRREVKLHLCDSARAKDPHVRQALLDRFGGEKAKGTKAAPGRLYGISKDLWAALGVLVTWCDRNQVEVG